MKQKPNYLYKRKPDSGKHIPDTGHVLIINRGPGENGEEHCSALRGYHGATNVDLEDETSHNFNILVWGVQHVDLIKTEIRVSQIQE